MKKKMPENLTPSELDILSERSAELDLSNYYSPADVEAKAYMINIVKSASLKPCDVGNGTNISGILPDWYNEIKFKRGQKYFSDNRFGILWSKLFGLIALFIDPKGLEVLDSTGRSSTAETAKKRYISTILHIISWYEDDLRPDSKSWASLNTVRKMHLSASKGADKKKIGIITQTELALTTFGFIGFPLVRPQFLGIRFDKKEDREGFIHFWAVIGHMLGVEDEYNMCLFDIETVENICKIMLRYIFIPTIQLETPKFKEMTEALLKGLSTFIPYMSYDIQMFLLKRIIGVPGYQFGVDLAKENICRQAFSTEELTAVREVAKSCFKLNDIIFDDGIPVLAPKNSVTIEIPIDKDSERHKNPHLQQYIEVCDKKFNWIMRSKDIDHWKVFLNDAEFYVLNRWDQLTVRWLCFVLKCYENCVIRYFFEVGVNIVLFFFRRYFNSNISR